MMNLVNNFGGQTQQVRQNPDEYAKQYAEQNGISFEEAKAELKSKYGDPQQQNQSSNIFTFGNSGNIGSTNYSSLQDEIASLRDEIASLEEKLFGKSETTETNTNNSSNTETNTNETKTSKSTNRIKEYEDKTLYKYLKNERGLSDEEIANISKDNEKKYTQELQQHKPLGLHETLYQS